MVEERYRPLIYDYAMTIREPYGIWGGLTEVERRSLLSRVAS